MSLPRASARRGQLLLHRPARIDLAASRRARHELLHVEGGTRIQHGAARRNGEHGKRIGLAAHEIARALDRIDGDIGLEDGARAAEPLPALGLRRLTLGRLADGHHGIDVDIGKRSTHGLERGTAAILAVTSADPAGSAAVTARTAAAPRSRPCGLRLPMSTSMPWWRSARRPRGRRRSPSAASGSAARAPSSRPISPSIRSRARAISCAARPMPWPCSPWRRAAPC